MENQAEGRTQADSYQTIVSRSEGLYKDRGSKFLYFAFPVKDEDEIKSELAALRKTYFDASHHCFAWTLGKEGSLFRGNDDGEPNHSAGDPILGQIRSNHLTNILIVVVRYFGGTKLGVSGLIQAYKTSAALAIEANEIVQEWVKVNIEITFPYPAMNEVMKIVKAHSLDIISQKMEMDCSLTLSFREGLREQVLEKLSEIDEILIKTD